MYVCILYHRLCLDQIRAYLGSSVTLYSSVTSYS